MNPRVFPSGARLPSAAIAVAMVIGSAALADPLPVRDAATVALLEQLQERDMPDVMLWVLDRVAADPKASADLKKQLPFRRASALVATTRTELDAAKRAAILDEAEKEIDRFLITGPEGRPAIDAFSQKGNLLIRRGQSKVEAAKRPGADAKALRAEAVGFFDGAVKALQGTVKRGQPVEKVTNAEDAVIKSLDAVEKRIAAIKPAKPGDDPKTPKTKPSSVSAATEKELQQLEDEQEALETKLVQTRLMTAETLFEKAKAFEPQSAEWQAALEESTKLHRDVADKYTNKGAGLFARYYQGRNLALLGKRQDAVSALSSVYAIDSPQPLIAALRAKSLAVALECWLAEKQYDQPDDAAMKFIVTPVKNTKKLDADWLAMKYRGALLLLAKADALPDGEKAKKGLLQKDALSLAVEVATANRDFAKEARELAAKLGKTVPKGPQEENSFAKAAADAGLKVATMKAKQAEAKELGRRQAGGGAGRTRGRGRGPGRGPGGVRCRLQARGGWQGRPQRRRRGPIDGDVPALRRQAVSRGRRHGQHAGGEVQRLAGQPAGRQDRPRRPAATFQGCRRRQGSPPKVDHPGRVHGGQVAQRAGGGRRADDAGRHRARDPQSRTNPRGPEETARLVTAPAGVVAAGRCRPVARGSGEAAVGGGFAAR